MDIIKKTKNALIVVLFVLQSVLTFAQPAVIMQPADVATCSGNTISFEIVATNTTVYQWQEHDGTGWFTINSTSPYASGEDTPKLTIADAIVGLNGYKYRCRIEDENGLFELSNPATLTVWESPLIIDNPVSQSVCKNETASFSITADYTNSYQWQENRGTGWYDLPDNSFYDGVNTSELSIHTIFGIDEYEYRCLVGNENCQKFSEIATLVVYPNPQVFHVLGGGVICEDSEGAEITLNDSEEDKIYILIKDGESTGIVKSGTGEVLSFGLQYDEGTYTVEAHDPETGCKIIMNNEVVISHVPVPEVYDVSGDGILCEGNSGSNIILSSSELDTEYRLLINGYPTGNNLEGTGDSLVFSNIVTEGVYTIDAISEIGCTSLMNGTVDISSNPLPTIFNVSGGGYICEGVDDLQIMLDNSEPGISYVLMRNGSPTTTSLSGTGDAIVFTNIELPGEYTLLAVNDISLCDNLMNGVAYVEEEDKPQQFELSGGGSFCEGNEGIPLLLSGSSSDCYYEIFKNNESTGLTIDGNGNQLFLGIYNQTGNYTVLAKDYESGCESWMLGEANIETLAKPVAFAGSDKVVVQGATTTLIGSASGSGNSFSYNWQPESLVDDPTIAAPTTIPLYSSQLFILRVTDQQSTCTSDPDSVVVYVGGGELNVEASASQQVICSNEEIQLFGLASGGTGLYDFDWKSIPPGFASDLVNPMVSPNENTEYIVTVSDGLTSDSDTIRIIVNESPQVFTVSGGGTYCNGSENIQVNLDGSEQGVNYLLYKNGIYTEQSYEGTGNPITISELSGTGVYTIIAQSNEGSCESEMEGIADISVVPRPVAYAGGQYVCQMGESVNLNGTAFVFSEDYSVQWSPVELVNSPNAITTQTVPLYTSSLFNLVVTDNQSGCESFADTALVNVAGAADLLHVSISSNVDTICEGEGVQMTALASGGEGNYTYTWTSKPEGFAYNAFNPTAYPVTSTRYYISVSDGENTAVDSIDIHVHTQVMEQTLSSEGYFCENNDAIAIQMDGSEQGVFYELLRNGQSTGNVVMGTGSPLTFNNINKEGLYSVKAMIAGADCETVMESTITISILSAPEAYAGENQTIGTGTTTQLNGAVFSGSGDYYYEWTPNDLVQNPNEEDPLTNILNASTEFIFRAIDQHSGCVSEPDTVLISVSGGSLTASAWATDEEICEGEEIRLFVLGSGGSGAYTYSWTSEPSGFTSTDYNPVVKPEVSTNYFVTVSDGNESKNLSVDVVVHERPRVNAGADQSIRLGNSVELIGTASGGTGVYSFIWQPESLLTNNTNDTVTSVPLFNNYSFTLTAGDENNCVSVADTTTVHVDTGTLSIKAVALPETVCYGNQVSLHALPSGGTDDYTISWTSNPPGFNATTFAAITTITEDTRFIATVSDGEHTVQTSILVKVNKNPNTYTMESSGYFCSGSEGASIKLDDSEVGIMYYLHENGYFNGNILEGNGESITFESITNESTYSVVAVDTNSNCTSTMNGSVIIQESASPESYQFSGEGVYCEGDDNAKFRIDNSQLGVSYQLYIDDAPLGDPIAGTGEALDFNNQAFEGEYLLIGNDDNTACETQMQGTVKLDIHPLPFIDLGEDREIYAGDEITLYAESDGNVTWTSPISQEGNSLSVNPTISTDYIAIATSINNCVATDTVKVLVNENEVPIINAFTPNGDGINDKFLEGFDIVVFNRWGQELYRGKTGWDGKYKGVYVNTGTYYYVRLSDIAGNTISAIKGSVTVIAPGNK